LFKLSGIFIYRDKIIILQRTKNPIIEKFVMQRFYRQQFKTNGLYSFRIEEFESDIFIVCDENLEKSALESIREARRQIEECIKEFPLFGASFEPLEIQGSVPPVPAEMLRASQLYNVGPMAAVAGAVAHYTGEILSPHCSHLFIENGGDICMKSSQPVTLSIYPGEHSVFRDKLKIKLITDGKLMGVCTSSGTIGHSFSFGKADAVVTIAERTEIADAAATSLCNNVKSPLDIETVINKEINRGILRGLLIVIDDRTGAWGDIEFV
jgi:uncharacterized protein